MDHDGGDEDITQILEQFLETCELPDFNPEEELMQFEKFQNASGSHCSSSNSSSGSGGVGSDGGGSRDSGRGGDNSGGSVGEGGSDRDEGGREEDRGTSSPGAGTEPPVVPLIEDMEVKNLVSLVEQLERADHEDAYSNVSAAAVPFRRGKNIDELFRAAAARDDNDDGSNAGGWSAPSENTTQGDWRLHASAGNENLTAKHHVIPNLASDKWWGNLTEKRVTPKSTGETWSGKATGKHVTLNPAGETWSGNSSGKRVTSNTTSQTWSGNLFGKHVPPNPTSQTWSGNLCGKHVTPNSTSEKQSTNVTGKHLTLNPTSEKCSMNSIGKHVETWLGNSDAENVTSNSTRKLWSGDSTGKSLSSDSTRENSPCDSMSVNWSFNSTEANSPCDSMVPNWSSGSTAANWASEWSRETNVVPSMNSSTPTLETTAAESCDFGAVLSQKIDDLLAVAMGRHDQERSVQTPAAVYSTPTAPAIKPTPATNGLRVTGKPAAAITNTTATSAVVTARGNSRGGGQRRRWINVSKRSAKTVVPVQAPALPTAAVVTTTDTSSAAAVATAKKTPLPWKIKSMTDYSPATYSPATTTTTSVRWKYILVPRRQLLHGKPGLARQRACLGGGTVTAAAVTATTVAPQSPPPLAAVRSTKRAVAVLGRWQFGTGEPMKTNMRTTTHIPVATTTGTVVVAAKKRGWTNEEGGNGGENVAYTTIRERPSPPKRQRWQTNILRSSSAAKTAAIVTSVPAKILAKDGLSVAQGLPESATTTTVALTKQVLENSVMLLIPKTALQFSAAKSFPPKTLVARVVTVDNAAGIAANSARSFSRWVDDTDNGRYKTNNIDLPTNEGGRVKTHDSGPCQPMTAKTAAFSLRNFCWTNARDSCGGSKGEVVAEWQASKSKSTAEKPAVERHQRRVSASGTWYPPVSMARTIRAAPTFARKFVCEEVTETDLRAVSLAENDANLPNLFKVLTFSTPVVGGGSGGGVSDGGAEKLVVENENENPAKNCANGTGVGSASGGVYFILFSLDDKDARRVSVSFPKERLEMFRAYRQYLRNANKRAYNLKLRGWHFITRNSISSLVHTTRTLVSRWKSARVIYFARLVVPSDKFAGKAKRTGLAAASAANIRYVWFAQLSQKIMHVWRRLNAEAIGSNAAKIGNAKAGDVVGNVKTGNANTESADIEETVVVGNDIGNAGKDALRSIAVGKPNQCASSCEKLCESATSESTVVASEPPTIDSNAALAASKPTAATTSVQQQRSPPPQSSFVRSYCFKNSLIFSFDGTTGGAGLRMPTNEDVARIVISLFNKQGFAVSYPEASRLTH